MSRGSQDITDTKQTAGASTTIGIDGETLFQGGVVVLILKGTADGVFYYADYLIFVGHLATSHQRKDFITSQFESISFKRAIYPALLPLALDLALMYLL